MEVQTTGGIGRTQSSTTGGAEVPTVAQLISKQRQLVGELQEAAIESAGARNDSARDFALATANSIDKLGTLTMIQTPEQPPQPSSGSLWADDKTGKVVRVVGGNDQGDVAVEVINTDTEHTQTGYLVEPHEWDRMVPIFGR